MGVDESTDIHLSQKVLHQHCNRAEEPHPNEQHQHHQQQHRMTPVVSAAAAAHLNGTSKFVQLLHVYLRARSITTLFPPRPQRMCVYVCMSIGIRGWVYIGQIQQLTLPRCEFPACTTYYSTTITTPPPQMRVLFQGRAACSFLF